jgi:hypothetical protein
VQLPLQAWRLEGTCDLGDLRRGEISRRSIAPVLADFNAAEYGLSEGAGSRLELAA